MECARGLRRRERKRGRVSYKDTSSGLFRRRPRGCRCSDCIFLPLYLSFFSSWCINHVGVKFIWVALLFNAAARHNFVLQYRASFPLWCTLEKYCIQCNYLKLKFIHSFHRFKWACYLLSFYFYLCYSAYVTFYAWHWWIPSCSFNRFGR